MNSKYNVGDRIFSYEKGKKNGSPYKAKILKKTFHNKVMKYYVHYIDSEDRYDAWVEESDITDKIEEKNSLKNEINTNFREIKMSSKEVTKYEIPQHERVRRSTKALGSQRKSSKSIEQEYENLSIKITIIPPLRKKLVDDWKAVTLCKEIRNLPCKPSVVFILNSWRDEQCICEPILDETLAFIKEIFDCQLGSQLLYRLEKNQYKRIIESYPQKKSSELYGAIHLLRLFVRLPFLLHIAQLEENIVERVKEIVVDLMDYMKRNIDSFFIIEYEPALEDVLVDC